MLTIFPIQYFGSISYYQNLIKHPNVEFEVCETYPKQTFRNRCSILTANGVQELSIPVVKPNGSKTLTKDILIDSSQNWRKLHWKAIQTAYSSAPFFDYYGIEIQELIEYDCNNLVEFDLNIHKRICSWLDLDTEFILTKDYLFKVRSDLRTFFDNRKTRCDYTYQQVFSTKANFVCDLSILDAILNLGSMARKFLV